MTKYRLRNRFRIIHAVYPPFLEFVIFSPVFREHLGQFCLFRIVLNFGQPIISIFSVCFVRICFFVNYLPFSRFRRFLVF